MKPRVAIVWRGVTGYLSACWRELARVAEVRVAIQPDDVFGRGFDAERELEGLDWRMGEGVEFAGWEADLALVCGWRGKLVRAAARHDFGGAVKVLVHDMGWEWSLRKAAARWALRGYVRRFDKCWIPGEASRGYSRWLGFAEGDIVKGNIGTDMGRFGETGDGEEEAGERRRFLFAGRWVREKGVDLLVEGFRRYREMGGTWDLRAVGAGAPDGFVHPREMGREFARAGALVLPSRYEPWGVVAAEAAGAGLPVIVSGRVGSRHELARGNAIVLEGLDAGAVARAMMEMERGHEGYRREAEAMRGRVREEYGAEAWARRCIAFCGAGGAGGGRGRSGNGGSGR